MLKMEKMNKQVFLLAALLVYLAAGAFFSAGAQEMFDDLSIRSAIVADLQSNEAVPAHLIDVAVSEGVVTLKGSVSSILAADKAVETAKTVKGVRSVVSLLEVKPVKRTDEEIMKDVQEALALDPATDRIDVQVAVDDSLVRLSGTADSVAEKRLCEEVAKGVIGVRGVENNIVADVKVNRPDAEIKADVLRLLESDVLVNADRIEIEVGDGVVNLSGSVGSAIEKTQAMRRAWVSGVKAVNTDNLEVKWWDEEKELDRSRYVHRTDVEIETAVADAFLYDPRLQDFDIQVDADNGTVTLRGTVDNLRAKKAAEKDARNTTGVWSVINEIAVRPLARATDEQIETMIQDAFARDSYLERHRFSVESYDGSVFLYGTANTRFEKNRAGEVASSVAGVVEVENAISVRKQWPYRADFEIERDIGSQLFWSPFVDSDDITVTVEDGVALLTGTVDEWSEYSAATENAYEGGARSVKNHLKVRAVREEAGM
jgi:osmotically-inducible protein OsmY